MSGQGILEKITVYLSHNDPGDSSVTIQVGIYEEDSEGPGSHGKIETIEAVVDISNAGWFDFNSVVNPVLENGKSYILAVICEGASLDEGVSIWAAYDTD